MLINRLASSLEYRAKWASFGVLYFRDLNLSSVRIAGTRVALKFPECERSVQEHELGRILFEDCYRLAEIRESIGTVLDIGANIGLFALAARHYFPQADVHCYEPNPDILRYLRNHCMILGIHLHPYAVGSMDGWVSLNRAETSLHSIATKGFTEGGASQPMKSFTSVINSLGCVDLLKLDCEGAEWDIFECREAWRHVRRLVMEYHLWAKPGSTLDDLRAELASLGFSHIEFEPSDAGQWGFAWARR
jgi:FkbM family methyltransferase